MLSSTLSTLLLSVSLASGVVATQQWAHVLPRELMRRQDQSFQPGTSSGQGETCKDAFGGDSKLCADSDVCYDESIGDSCCSEGYPCPSGSFCLIKGFCCPDGVDAKTCAIDNGVTLPDDFGTSETKAPPPAATETTATVQVSSAPAKTTETTASVQVSSAPPTVTPPFPIPSGTGAPAASGTAPSGGVGTGIGIGTGTGGVPRPSSSLTPYTGAASSLHVMRGGLFGALLGLVCMMAVL